MPSMSAGFFERASRASLYGDEAREVFVQPVEGFEEDVRAYSADHSRHDARRAVARGDRGAEGSRQSTGSASTPIFTLPR